MRCVQNLKACLSLEVWKGQEPGSRELLEFSLVPMSVSFWPLLPSLSLCRKPPSASLDHMGLWEASKFTWESFRRVCVFSLPLSQLLPLQIPNFQRRNSDWPGLSQVSTFGPASCDLFSRVTQQKYGYWEPFVLVREANPQNRSSTDSTT